MTRASQLKGRNVRRRAVRFTARIQSGSTICDPDSVVREPSESSAGYSGGQARRGVRDSTDSSAVTAEATPWPAAIDCAALMYWTESGVTATDGAEAIWASTAAKTAQTRVMA